MVLWCSMAGGSPPKNLRHLSPGPRQSHTPSPPPPQAGLTFATGRGAPKSVRRQQSGFIRGGGFLSPQTLLGPSPQGVGRGWAISGPTAVGSRGSYWAGKGVKIFGLGFPGFHSLAWDVHGLPN